MNQDGFCRSEYTTVPATGNTDGSVACETKWCELRMRRNDVDFVWEVEKRCPSIHSRFACGFFGCVSFSEK